jgi:hypothetical protein
MPAFPPCSAFLFEDIDHLHRISGERMLRHHQPAWGAPVRCGQLAKAGVKRQGCQKILIIPFGLLKTPCAVDRTNQLLHAAAWPRVQLKGLLAPPCLGGLARVGKP